jgi:transcription antitermination factor NusG
MLAMTDKGNLETVREALSGITGVKLSPDRDEGADWFMVVVRSNYHLDAVDGLRRQGLRAYWPSYERSIASKRLVMGRQTRRSVRFGILPYVLSPHDETVDFKSRCERVTAIMDIVRTYSGSPLLLKDRDLTIIRRIDVSMNTPKPEATGHNFKTGHKVKFKDDLSAQWPPGLIVKIAKEGRISVEVNMMGRKVPVTVFPHQIERI